MTRHFVDRLSPEDRVLWSKVARTATPLRSTVFVPDAEPPLPQPEPAGLAAAAPPGAMPAKPDHAVRHGFDRPTRERLSGGRVEIGGRVDLHGMTQHEAHGLLLSFLSRAAARGARYVLVITGKGRGGEGVLRRAVPGWLATAAFRPLVSGYDEAALKHGGAGAIYVRLRRGRGA